MSWFSALLLKELLGVVLLTISSIVLLVIFTLIVYVLARLVVVEVRSVGIWVPLAIAPHVPRIGNLRLRRRLNDLGLGLRRLNHRSGLRYCCLWLRILIFIIFITVTEESILCSGLLFGHCCGWF